MRFIVSSSLLSKNLSALSGVLNSSNTLPILDDFLFELAEDSLMITASDLETTMTVSIPLDKAEDPGAVTIPAKILIDTLKTFSDIPVQFTINKETLGVEISAGDGKYKLSGHKSDEFPVAPELDQTSSVTFGSELLVNAINKTLFAAGNDELRPVMSGVFFELTPDDITCFSTDPHNMVPYRRTDFTAGESTSFIMPKKPLNQLKSILSSAKGDVSVDYNQTNAVFSFDNVRMTCRLIDGKYPNYEAVIPTDNPHKLTIDRQALLNSIRRVAIFANQSTHQVRFKLSGKELLLSAEDIDFANEAKERLTCSYEGDDMEIGFNSRFLQEMLTNIDSDEIILEMSAPNRAGIMHPLAQENEAEDILMLVMPVMLNQ